MLFVSGTVSEDEAMKVRDKMGYKLRDLGYDVKNINFQLITPTIITRFIHPQIDLEKYRNEFGGRYTTIPGRLIHKVNNKSVVILTSGIIHMFGITESAANSIYEIILPQLKSCLC